MKSINGALLVLFVALKLTHVIDWSWWWVTAPAWFGFTGIFLLLIGAAIIQARNDEIEKEQARLRRLKRAMMDFK